MALTANPNPLYGLNGDIPTYAGYIEPSTIYNAESQLIRGTMSFSKDKLRELDPSYTGYTHIFVLRLPPFMTNIAQGHVISGTSDTAITDAQNHCRNLKALIELGSTSYSGTPDLTLNSSEVNTGFSERSYAAPTYSAYDGKSFTVRCLETRGEPLRRALEYWINGISDANIKATHMHNATNLNGTLMEPTLANYTMSIMVVQTDQRLITIQDVSIWNNITPTNIARSQLDWENGSIDIVQPTDLQFNGVYLPDSNNATVLKQAYTCLGRRLKLYRRFQDMDDTMIGATSWSQSAEAF